MTDEEIDQRRRDIIRAEGLVTDEAYEEMRLLNEVREGRIILRDVLKEVREPRLRERIASLLGIEEGG